MYSDILGCTLCSSGEGAARSSATPGIHICLTTPCFPEHHDGSVIVTSPFSRACGQEFAGEMPPLAAETSVFQKRELQ